MNDAAQKKNTKAEYKFWKEQLQKANRTDGMKFPKGGIIDKKYGIKDKADFLIKHLRKKQQNAAE